MTTTPDNSAQHTTSQPSQPNVSQHLPNNPGVPNLTPCMTGQQVTMTTMRQAARTELARRMTRRSEERC